VCLLHPRGRSLSLRDGKGIQGGEGQQVGQANSPGSRG
jgi:hypothetical protein